MAKETLPCDKVKDFETGEILPDYPGALSAITRVPYRSKGESDHRRWWPRPGEARHCAASSEDRASGLKEPGMQGAQLCKMGKVREGPSLEPWQEVWHSWY